MKRLCAALGLLAICGAGELAALAAPLPEQTCAGTPATGPRSWRHPIKSRLVRLLGKANHRGIDLVAAEGSATQTLRGELRYGWVDKSLEDETVALYACEDATWHWLGTARSDSDGHFALALTGADRLPVGMRTLYLSVVGDGSGAAFVAVVAPAGTPLVVSDVDGTLTESENAYPMSLLTGHAVAANDGAMLALNTLRAKGYLPVYVSSRGRFLTEPTRTWLTSHGFPRGALILASAPITLPGAATRREKARALADVTAGGLAPAIGLGNRASDAEAYAAAGIPSARIFIKLPEFASELAALLQRGEATGFASYALDLVPLFKQLPPRP